MSLHNSLNSLINEQPNEQPSNYMSTKPPTTMQNKPLLIRTNFEYDEQSTQPFINNQNSVVMVARSVKGYLMLMHETRIFYFEYSGDKNQIDSQPKYDRKYGEASDHLVKVMISILTTRKYRLLQSFYTLSRVLDYVMLASLILLLLLDNDYDNFSHIIEKYWLIFMVIGLEIFYDVLEFIVKIWILNRLSIYIGVVLYILYFFALFVYEKYTSTTVTVLFGLRFLAFVLEEATDYCIDLELEYDLNVGKGIHKLDVPKCIKKCVGRFIDIKQRKERLAMLHVTDYDIELGGTDWKFKGTRCVWTTDNVFDCDVCRKQDINPRCYRWFFDILFIITYGPIALPLYIVMGFVVSIILCVRCCCRCCNKCDGSSIWDEIGNPNSY
eukprot:429237_1